MVTQIKEDANKINLMINDLLDVSRIESGRLKYNFSKFDFDTFMKTTIRTCSYLSSTHKIIFKGKTKIYLKGDKERLRQVIENLISNAIKYSPKGRKIIISVYIDGRTLTLSIRDFGIGIPKNKQQHIFDKYYRTASGERNAQGLGLGLYISKEIILAHGGEIWVESEKNMGTTFYISLPIMMQTNIK